MDSDIAYFVGITGSSERAARQVIDMCAGDVSQAIQLWFNDEELQRNLDNPGATATSSSRVAGTSLSSGAAIASDANHPAGATGSAPDTIVIPDSDEEEYNNNNDVTMGAPQDDDDLGAAEAEAAALRAQEQADAELAHRLQDELYGGGASASGGGARGGGGGGAGGVDDVRAPMARTTETLVAPVNDWRDDDEDSEDTRINDAIIDQLRRRIDSHGGPQAGRVRGPNNPFSQSIWHDEPSGVTRSAAELSGQQASRATRLAELFRPPYDLMQHVSWDEARDLGKEQKKWILVNLQNMSDFNCQALNRDIWKDEAVKDIVSHNFIFLQYDKDDVRAEHYISFYFPNQSHENPSNYPHVGIIDPRTGEQVKVFSGTPFPNALQFHALLAEFLDRYSLDLNSKNPVARTKQPARAVDVNRLTEDEMLQMAMQNSIMETASGGGSASQPTFNDPDELTKEETTRVAAADAGGKGKEKDTAEETTTKEETESSGQTKSSQLPESEDVDAKSSIFATISSNLPHVEPKNDPETTTRIQFRHPNGRIIRRFYVAEPVIRLYEWLKADPLEGQEGRDFELKVMPSGHDLIEDINQSIGKVGLKQATVMIEYL